MKPKRIKISERVFWLVSTLSQTHTHTVGAYGGGGGLSSVFVLAKKKKKNQVGYTEFNPVKMERCTDAGTVTTFET